MPINNITQTISELPAAGARGVDVQTVFVTKQEDFQDHLQGTTVTELNTLTDQLNTRIGEINSTATTMNGYAGTASASASTATTKAGEASTSASEALTSRNQASTFATNASNSETRASKWAENNYNVLVEAGKYSAKHWSTVAQNATVNKVDKVTSIDNAIVRFDGTTGAVQNSAITIDDNGNLNLTGTGKRITGDFSSATVTNRVAFQTSTLNGTTVVSVVPNGTAQSSFSSVYNNSDGNNSSFIQISARPTTVSIDSSAIGTGSTLPMVFSTGGTERMRIDAAGNVLVTGSGGLGYGAGSGGSVTQLTSKSTAVTLNKPSGRIIMNNAALAPSGIVSFSVYNTAINYADTICYSLIGGLTNINNYSITIYTREDSMDISITNKSSTSLSEPVEIMYSIIRGALS